MSDRKYEKEIQDTHAHTHTDINTHTVCLCQGETKIRSDKIEHFFFWHKIKNSVFKTLRNSYM